MTEPIETIIKRVAELLGVPGWMTDEEIFDLNTACTGAVLQFAAYVKAALAERGWGWWTTGEEFEFGCFVCAKFETDDVEFDPTNNTGEARAIISAADEALSLTQEDA